MKSLKTFLVILFCYLVSSCTSEYRERLYKAKELKKELRLIMRNNDIHDRNEISEELLFQINKQAKLSGNQKMFLSELNNK